MTKQLLVWAVAAICVSSATKALLDMNSSHVLVPESSHALVSTPNKKLESSSSNAYDCVQGVLVIRIGENGVFCRGYVSPEYDKVYFWRQTSNGLASSIVIEAYPNGLKSTTIRIYSDSLLPDFGTVAWFELMDRDFRRFKPGSPPNYHLLNEMSSDLYLTLDALEEYPRKTE